MLAQAATSGRTGDRAPQVGSSDGSLLVAGEVGRCAPYGAVRGRLQPALVDAGDDSFGERGFFFAHFVLVADGRDVAWAIGWRLLRTPTAYFRWCQVNFAGLTK